MGAAEALVRVRVRPRSRPGLEWRDGQLVISVAAAPVGGRATEEARRALAEVVGVPPGAVFLRSGATSRTKTFLVTGLATAEVRARLERAVRPAE